MIVLAIDSGLERTGFAIFKIGNKKPSLIDFGCIFTLKKETIAQRIKVIVNKLAKIIKKYSPDVLVLEQLFFGNNQKTVIEVAQAQGAVLYLAAKNNARVETLTPLQIKQSITGYGKADKKQVEKMLKYELELDTMPKPDDICDAIACGYAYSFMEKFDRKLNT